MLRLSPMAKENEQYQQKRLTSFLCFSKSLIFFSYTSTSQGLAGVFSAAFPVWGQHKTFPNPQHTCFCLKPHQEELLYSFIVKAFIIGAICKEHCSFFFFFYIKKNLKLRYELPSVACWPPSWVWRRQPPPSQAPLWLRQLQCPTALQMVLPLTLPPSPVP